MRRFAAAAALAAFALPAASVPPTRAELEQWCTGAEDMAHCGRLIEQQQLRRLPGLAKREGVNLRVALFPSGSATFTDVENPVQPLSYSLFDSIDPINAVLLLKSDGERVTFVLLQRAGNHVTELPSEPSLSPDRQRLATADFCSSGCSNELVVWRVTREGVARELAWRSAEDWADATPQWKDAETVVVDYTPASDGTPRTLERKLGQGGWTRPR
ncbi:hypothetical protein BURK1_03690 [Burkholderiales bacterium]|nr:hypothetical protein BURK1_03690 [Burkholderiales bacterium]